MLGRAVVYGGHIARWRELERKQMNSMREIPGFRALFALARLKIRVREPRATRASDSPATRMGASGRVCRPEVLRSAKSRDAPIACSRPEFRPCWAETRRDISEFPFSRQTRMPKKSECDELPPHPRRLDFLAPWRRSGKDASSLFPTRNPKLFLTRRKSRIIDQQLTELQGETVYAAASTYSFHLRNPGRSDRQVPRELRKCSRFGKRSWRRAP